VARPFVGLDNYKNALTDPAVLQSFRNVGVFLLINVPLTVVLALVLAVALNRAARARTFFRVSFYVPYVTASVAVVAVWLFLFSGGGLVNNLLGPLAPNPSWLRLTIKDLGDYTTTLQALRPGTRVFVEGLKRAGRDLTREKFIGALESMGSYDLGGFTINYSPASHIGSKFVEMTIINSSGQVIR